MIPTIPDKVAKVQELMRQLPQAECEVFHHFVDGLYARELHIPAGVALVGALHKTNHLYTVQTGECRVVSQEGEQTIKGPFMGRTKPGEKRIIHAITDCVWITFHPTDKTNISEIAKEILETEL